MMALLRNTKPLWSGLHDHVDVVHEASTSATRLQLVILDLEHVVGLQALIQVLPKRPRKNDTYLVYCSDNKNKTCTWCQSRTSAEATKIT